MPEEQEEVQAEAVETEASPESTPDIPEWRAGLPEDVRDLESLTKFDKAENPFQALVNGFLGAERAIGAEKIALPGRDATEEEWRQVWTRLGCPEDVGKYEPPSENVSEHFDPELFKGLAPEAHRLGLTRQQYAGIARAFDQRAAEHLSTQENAKSRQLETWEQELKEKHGEAFDQNMELARGLVNEIGGDPMVELLEETGLGSHPVVVNFMTKVARLFAEDEILGVGAGTRQFSNTPEQAQEEWRALQLDKEYMEAWRDGNHPGHKAAIERQERLFQQMHPEPARE